MGFGISGPMLRPRLRNLANEPLEAWPCIGLEFNFARLRFWSVGHGAGMIKPLDHDAHERERRTMHDNVVRCILNWAHLEDELEHVPPQLNQGDSRGAEDGRGYRH
jgi:hypothetical protein